MTKQIRKGLAIHCHHGMLIEYCYDSGGRIETIKWEKPQNEIEIRLRLFQILPDEAIKDLSPGLIRAYAQVEEAYDKWHMADTEWQMADAELEASAERDTAYAQLDKADAKLEGAYAKAKKANVEWGIAYAAWGQKDKDTFHKKWCGCKEWRNNHINFSKKGG